MCSDSPMVLPMACVNTWPDCEVLEQAGPKPRALADVDAARAAATGTSPRRASGAPGTAAQAGRSPSLPARISALRSKAHSTRPCSFSSIVRTCTTPLSPDDARLGAEDGRARAHRVAGVARLGEAHVDVGQVRDRLLGDVVHRERERRGSSRAGDAAGDLASRTPWRRPPRRIDRRGVEERRLEQRHRAAVDGHFPRVLVGRTRPRNRDSNRP